MADKHTPAPNWGRDELERLGVYETGISTAYPTSFRDQAAAAAEADAKQADRKSAAKKK